MHLRFLRWSAENEPTHASGRAPKCLPRWWALVQMGLLEATKHPVYIGDRFSKTGSCVFNPNSVLTSITQALIDELLVCKVGERNV